MSDLDDGSVPLGPPTHYTNSFDDTGRPYACGAHDTDARDVLPEGWDDVFWEWSPKGDPSGRWVQRVDAFRKHLWKEVKSNREAATEGTVDITLGSGTKLPVQASREARSELRGLLGYMGRPKGPNSIKWTLADNSRATLSRPELAEVIDALEEHTQNVHEWSQDLRDQIFDPSNDTIEKLKTISTRYGE